MGQQPMTRKLNWDRARTTAQRQRYEVHATRDASLGRVKTVAPLDKPKVILARAEVIARLKARKWPTDKRPK